jgi:hypothetical protein
LEENALRMQIARTRESQVEREERLALDANRQQNSRANESQAEREERLALNADRQQNSRANQSQDDREHRLIEDMVRHQVIRMQRRGGMKIIAFIEDCNARLDIESYIIGDFDAVCSKCDSLHFLNESHTRQEEGLSFSICCSYGKFSDMKLNIFLFS